MKQITIILVLQIFIVAIFSQTKNQAEYLPSGIVKVPLSGVTLPNIIEDSTTNDTIATFNLYPNPVNGILHIGYNKPIVEAFIVRIYNLISNEQVYENEMSAEPFLIDVNNWQNGYYSVVVTNTNEEVLFRSKTRIKN